jgi:hypothetical protein
MKILTIKINEKTYTTGKITTSMSREAIRINRQAIEMAKVGKQLKEQEDIVEATESLFDMMEDLSNRKANLICNVFGNAFTANELEDSLESEEVDEMINKILTGITGIVQKNV